MEQNEIFEYKTIEDQSFIKFNKFTHEHFYLISQFNWIPDLKRFVASFTFELSEEYRRFAYCFRSFENNSDYAFSYLPGIKEFLKNYEHTINTIDNRIGSENISEAGNLVGYEKMNEFIELLNYNLSNICESVNNKSFDNLKKDFIG